MERKVFLTDEIKYLIFALEKVRCYGLDETQQEYKCPYWNWEIKNEQGVLGDCSVKQSQKLCILMQVAVSGELKLVLRDKVSEDSLKEKYKKTEVLQKQADALEQEIIERQHKLEEVQRQQKKVIYETKS
jgi:hypothetical protein